LPTVEQPLRVAEFDDLFATAVAPTERVGTTGLRIHLPAATKSRQLRGSWSLMYPSQPTDHVPEVGRATATVNDPLPLPVVRS
jgi:hypothetical protein